MNKQLFDEVLVMSRITKVSDKFARFVLLAVSEKANHFFGVQYIIKNLLDSVFVIFRIFKVEAPRP